jgi:hypothetical protein
MVSYVDFEYFQSIHGDAVPETDFNRYSWEATKRIDSATTGVDGIKKLKVAFPTDEEDVEAIKRCACKIIAIAVKIKQAEEIANSARGYIQREDGSFQAKIVSSVSAGNESVSYSSSGVSGTATLIDKVLADKSAQKQLYDDTISEFLSGIHDANGVNLLYMGEYPYQVEE